MSSQPPHLGKGVFGYRKSAVDQTLADRDAMLRHAEGRVRAGESKVAELERELAATRERNARMEEHLMRLRSQSDALTSRAVEVDRRWSEIEAEGERLASWREEAESAIGLFAQRLKELRVRLEEVPERVQHALSPLAAGVPCVEVLTGELTNTLSVKGSRIPSHQAAHLYS